MSKILCFLPTYSPFEEADKFYARALRRLTQQEIAVRLGYRTSRAKPWMYMDSIDSILNIGAARVSAGSCGIDLVVGDGRSTDSIRDGLGRHHMEAGGYRLELYHDRMSQWVILNDVLRKYATEETEYFVYSSSDVIWTMDWVGEAVKAFEADPKLLIIFPCTNRGDPNLPCQIAYSARDLPLIEPPYQDAAMAPVLNMYACIFRMSFLREYGGYPDVYKNCFTESFLQYQCEAMGGYMRLMPRGHIFHWGEGDLWRDEEGSTYNYFKEKPLFDKMIVDVLKNRESERMTVEYLKSVLYVTEEQQHRAVGGIGE